MNELKKLCNQISKISVSKCEIVPDGWYTIKQISKEMKVSEPTALRRVNIMIEKKQLQKKKFRVETSTGSYPIPHYRNVSTK